MIDNYKGACKSMMKLGDFSLDWGVRESLTQEITFKLRLEEETGIVPDVEDKEEMFKGEKSCVKKALRQLWEYFSQSPMNEMRNGSGAMGQVGSRPLGNHVNLVFYPQDSENDHWF